MFLRIAFFLHGYQKLPLPFKNMMVWFGFFQYLATIPPLPELIGCSLISKSGLIKEYWRSLFIRLAGLIFMYMVFALAIAHQDWFITPRLFMSEQIFLYVLGFYFLLKGEPQKG